MEDWFLLAMTAIGVLGIAITGRSFMAAQERLTQRRLDSELELAKLKSGWYQQMQRAKAEKSPKKKRDEQEDDEDDDVDDIDVLIEAIRPFKPLVAGFAASKKVPLDFEALMEHDPKEKAKVQVWIESQMAKTSSGGNVQSFSGGGDGWVLPAP